MKTSLPSWWVFLLLFAATTLRNVAGKQSGGFWDDKQGFVKSCDDYEEREVTAEGAMTFLRPLLCEKPLIFNIYNDTVVRSRHAINTTNVHFVVHPSATLTMKARVIAMSRDEASTRPVVKVFGKVKFEARAWSASYVNGTLEDSDGVVRIFRGGGFASNQPVRFTTSAFVVANEQARGEKKSLVKLSPYLEELLTEFQAQNRTKLDTPETSGSPSSSSDSTAEGICRITPDTPGTTTTSSSSSSSSSSSINSCSSSTGDIRSTHRVSRSSSSNADSSGDTRIDSSGVEAARKTSRERPLDKTLALNYRVSKHLHELKMVNLENSVKNNAASNLSRGSANNNIIKNHGTHRPKNPWVRKPTCSLQVGETLTGPLRSPGGGSILWPGVDGSIMFGKYQETPSTEDGGGGEGAGPRQMRFTTLLSSDSRIVRNVMGMRRSKVRAFDGKGGDGSGRKMGTAGGWLPGIRRAEKNRLEEIGTTEEKPEDDKRQDSGRKMGTAGGWLPLTRPANMNHLDEIGTAPDNAGFDSEIARKILGMQKPKVLDMSGKGNDEESGTKMGTAWSRLPWAREGNRNRFDEIGTAADKTGEVCASVSNKGCVEVTVDGITVLSKSGPYTWDWLNRLPWARATDEGYEVHVTDDGMEVRLEERTVWGIKAEEWIG